VAKCATAAGAAMSLRSSMPACLLDLIGHCA
jgi:hypothetical protein